MSVSLTAWFMNITKARIKSSVWDLIISSKAFALIDSEAIVFLTSKLATFLESSIISGWWHATVASNAWIT